MSRRSIGEFTKYHFGISSHSSQFKFQRFRRLLCLTVVPSQSGQCLSIRRKKKVPGLDPNPTSSNNARLSTTPSPVKMVKRKIGALEKVEADL